jgi:3',5'-cyclic AMP phosphodiesterase CpdA
MIGDPQYDSLWCELFTSVGFIPTTIPFVMVPGNHEYPKPKGTETQKELVPYWRAHYTLPENGVKGLEETSYSFDYQGVRFIMINGNEKLAEQAGWMESILAKNPCTWTVLAMHQPLYSMGRERDDRKTRDAFLPLIDKYGVDLVLTGHDHVYSRSRKLKNNATVPDREKGTVYVVSVSGSKAYSLNPKYKELMVKTGEKVQLFQTISINGNKLEFKSFTATGLLYDSFELTK